MRAAFATVATLVAAAALGQSPAPPQVDYWKVPWDNSRPRDPDVDANAAGRALWFGTDNYLVQVHVP